MTIISRQSFHFHFNRLPNSSAISSAYVGAWVVVEVATRIHNLFILNAQSLHEVLMQRLQNMIRDIIIKTKTTMAISTVTYRHGVTFNIITSSFRIWSSAIEKTEMPSK